ncbi:MAG: hypothetical protein AAGJ46_13650 [Planctomycetota bacterium]
MAAARNDQTLQIALIVFVGMAVVLGGFLVYVNRLRADYKQQVDSLKQANSEELRKASDARRDNENLRLMIGLGQFDKFEDVQKQYEADQSSFMASFQPEDRVYRKSVALLDAENKRGAEQEAQAKQREKELKARLLATEAEKDAQIKKMQETLKKVEADAASERLNFNQARAELEKQKQQAIAAVQRQRADFEKKAAELNEQINSITAELDQTKLARNSAQDELKVIRGEPSFEIADGSVSYVNQANGTVWIDLGKLDSLRRQVTFSVFEQTAADAGKADKKASIEVTRILGDHIAEARITTDDPKNPILPGDWIYSPLWHRGRQIHFALTGVLDLDGDDKPDVQRAKDLVNLNDGVVDAAVNEDGSFEGKLTPETRYLVLGDYPSKPSQGTLRTSWDAMNDQAEELGIATITLEEFLNQMGYKPLDKTVQLGADARAEDFVGGANFRPRTPYSGR